MAKEAKKVQTKAKINWGWDAPEDRDGKASRSNQKPMKKSTQKKIKKIGFKGFLIVLIVMLIGCAIGVGVTYCLTKDDCFTIVGSDEITLCVGEEYFDEGVNVVSFGRDVVDKVYTKTNLTTTENGGLTATEEGTYYIIYKVDDIKYGKIFTVQRIRLVTFVEASIGENVD